MRVFTLSLAILIACFMLATDKVHSEPTPQHLATRQINVTEEQWFMYQIAREYQDVLKIPQNISLFAFCSITGKENCMEYRDSAYTQFWKLLQKGNISEEERKAVDLVIARGDAPYVRLLFADGTIFCRRTDGNYVGPLNSFTISQQRKNMESKWAIALSRSPVYFTTIPKKYLARFQYSQVIQGLDQVDSSLAAKGCISYYDVSIRDGLDSMVKWAVGEGFKDIIQPILDAFPPQGRFFNFMLGSLYDAIILNNPDIMTTLRAWVDCTKVRTDYQQFCNSIQAHLKNGGSGNDFPHNSNIVAREYMSTVAHDDSASVQREIRSFNRRDINLLWLLD